MLYSCFLTLRWKRTFDGKINGKLTEYISAIYIEQSHRIFKTDFEKKDCPELVC